MEFLRTTAAKNSGEELRRGDNRDALIVNLANDSQPSQPKHKAALSISDEIFAHHNT